MNQFLGKAFDIAINGASELSISSAYELAADYSGDTDSLDRRIDRLIRFQDAKAATSGFVTGLGGVITLPVTIPVNISSVLFVQLRMIAAIAITNGYDVKDDQVKTLCYVCLTGSGAEELLKNTGIVVRKKILQAQLKKMSADVLKKINQKVGFRLVTNFGEKGIINLSKLIPVAGGLVGGTLDGVTTHAVGKAAKRIFQSQ